MYINKMDKPKHNTFTGATGRGGKQLRTECQVKCDLYHPPQVPEVHAQDLVLVLKAVHPLPVLRRSHCPRRPLLHRVLERW